MNFWYKKEKIQLKSQNNLNKNIMKDTNHISSNQNDEEHLIPDPIYGWRLGKSSDTHFIKD